jgi:predicted AAA+ superfamily ATPase
MEYLERILEKQIIKYLKPNKVVVILGARRVGKTALVKKIISQIQEKNLLLNGEDLDTQALLERRSQKNYEQLLGKTKLLIIDEAQSIPDIGAKLKLMVDSIEGLKILVTGSSVFDLNNKIGEPLVGRKTTFYLYPLSQEEFSKTENLLETKANFEERLILGSYPELQHLSSKEEKIIYLKEQINSYLLKDILAFEGIQKREKIVSLLKILAFRIGSEISVEGIGNELQISKNTVDKYLDLLSKVFIIHQVSGFNRNLDNEITKKHKWYFYDNGIRNALISNFNALNSREDEGKLWENYLISERKKHQEYNNLNVANYFWRTHTKQEIDWIEEKDGELFAYEFKWNPNKKVKVPSNWEKAYPKAKFSVIHPDNYLDFIVE